MAREWGQRNGSGAGLASGIIPLPSFLSHPALVLERTVLEERSGLLERTGLSSGFMESDAFSGNGILLNLSIDLGGVNKRWLMVCAVWLLGCEQQWDGNLMLNDGLV